MQHDSLIKPTPEVYVWVEQETSVMLEAVTTQGDPVELNEHELENVILALQLSLSRLHGKQTD